MENPDQTTDLTFEDIRRRKRIVLEKIRKEKKNISVLSHALLEEYKIPKLAGLTSFNAIRRTGQVISGTIYALNVIKSVGKVIGKFRPHIKG